MLNLVYKTNYLNTIESDILYCIHLLLLYNNNSADLFTTPIEEIENKEFARGIAIACQTVYIFYTDTNIK